MAETPGGVLTRHSRPFISRIRRPDILSSGFYLQAHISVTS